MVACYCATFLKPEMLHIYRQITALRRVRKPVQLITQKRRARGTFSVQTRFLIVPKPAMHFLRRIWYRQMRDVPWMISQSETANLIRVLETNHAQLLHIYFGHIAVHLLPLIERWQKPSVVSFHGADVMVDLEKPAYRAATVRMLQAVRRVLVRSESLQQALVSLGCPADKIRLQRTGIPLSELEYRPRVFPSDGRWQLLQAGRLIEKKGFRTSLRAFAKFTQRYPAAQFTIAGDGPLLSELQALAQELGVADRVQFRRLPVPGRVARTLLSRAHFPAPERNRNRWKSGRRAERNVGSDGQRAAGVRHGARRNS